MVDEQAQVPEPDEPGQSDRRTDLDGKDAGGTETPQATQVRLRRAPRYRAFVLTGIVLGVIAAAVIVFSGLFPLHEEDSVGTVFGYFAAVLSLVGGLMGAGAAILVERRR